MNIAKVPFYAMRQELHYEFHKSVLANVDKLDSNVLASMDLGVVLPPYRAAFTVEKGILDLVTTGKYSKPMAEKDRERDHAHAGFVAAVKAMLYHFDKDVRDAAERVMGVFKHYGDVSKKNYNEETAAIEDMLRKLDGDDFMKDLQTLKVMVWRDRLKAFNDAFENLAHQRYEERASMPNIRMTDARKETDHCYRNLTAHIEEMQTLGKSSPELIAFVCKMNAMIKEYKDIIARQKSKPKPEEDDDASTEKVEE